MEFWLHIEMRNLKIGGLSMNDISIEAMNNKIYKNEIVKKKLKQNGFANEIANKHYLNADEFSRLVETVGENQLNPIKFTPVRPRSSLLDKILRMLKK